MFYDLLKEKTLNYKSKMNYYKISSEILLVTLLSSIITFSYGWLYFLSVWAALAVFSVFVMTWKVRLKEISVDDAIHFKRFLFKEHKIDIDQIIDIKFYNDDKKRLFTLNRSFLEVSTSKRYYTYNVGHFKINEIKEMLYYLSNTCNLKCDDL